MKNLPAKALFSLFVIISLAVITGCSSPHSMVFAPQKNYTMATIYNGQSFAIEVDDKRTSKHLLRVTDSDGKKQSYPSSSPINNQLKDNLQTGFAVQGINIDADPAVAPTITLSVNQLEAIVKQDNFEYNAAFVVEFKLQITQGNKTFSKIFTGNATNKGILRYDVAKMEQELNKLVSAVFDTIYADLQVRQNIEV